jgi:hypothetical protein
MIKGKAKRGRPTTFTTALAIEICDVIASTSKGSKRLCAENLHWPSQDTLFQWLKSHADFSELYAQAKRAQVELLIDEILEIADDCTSDVFVNEDGKMIPNSAVVKRARLQIDTRKWIACKLAPRIYGTKVDTTLSLYASHEEALKELAKR